MIPPRDTTSTLLESTRQGEPARSEIPSTPPARPSLQRPSTPSHVWFAFDRWLSVEVGPSDDDFVLA